MAIQTVMGTPRRTLVRQFDTHRLINSRHSEESVLVRIADDDEHLRDIFDLDHATNERLLGEHDLLPGLGLEELVFGVPHYHIINASFCHPHPLGSRFNGPDRGAWYASFAIETAQTEVAFHKAIELAEVNWFQESCTYDDYLADFSAEFHDIRRDAAFRSCLAPDSYYASQELSEQLLRDGSLGIVYPSVRHEGGTCLACFRPALIANVRRAATYRFVWDGSPVPAIELVSERKVGVR